MRRQPKEADATGRLDVHPFPVVFPAFQNGAGVPAAILDHEVTMSLEITGQMKGETETWEESRA